MLHDWRSVVDWLILLSRAAQDFSWLSALTTLQIATHDWGALGACRLPRSLVSLLLRAPAGGAASADASAAQRRMVAGLRVLTRLTGLVIADFDWMQAAPQELKAALDGMRSLKVCPGSEP